MAIPSQEGGLDHRVVELDGVRYVILREPLFEALCQRAGIDTKTAGDGSLLTPGLDLDKATLAEKLCGDGGWRACRRRNWRAAPASGRRRSTASSAGGPRPTSPRSANSWSPSTRRNKSVAFAPDDRRWNSVILSQRRIQPLSRFGRDSSLRSE